MLSLNLSNHRIVIDATSLTIKELRDIYDSDTDPLKRQSTDILTYIHIASQLDSTAPFYTAKVSEVEALAARNVWGTEWSLKYPDLSMFRDKIEAYVRAFEKVENRILQAYSLKIDEFEEMLGKIKPEIKEVVNAKTNVVTYATNTNHIMKVMKDIRSMIIEKRELEDMIRGTNEKETKRWGGRSQSYLEKKKAEQAINQTREESSPTLIPEHNEPEQKRDTKKKELKTVHENVRPTPENF